MELYLDCTNGHISSGNWLLSIPEAKEHNCKLEMLVLVCKQIVIYRGGYVPNKSPFSITVHKG